MYRTFNMGAGFVVIVSHDLADAAMENLRSNGMPTWVIGEVIPRPDTGEAVVFR
jgi:phosphoribosylformylglycinamidine cyclo-ligase